MNTHDFILAKAQKGDSGAIDALLRLHYDSIHAVCHRIVINSADADDATQMALIAIARALPSFDRRSSLTTWIYRIATNAALDELRRIRRRPIANGDAVLAKTQDDSTGEIDTQMLISNALSLIAPEFRVVVVLRHIADLDYEQIASVLQIPVGTVRSRLARGRAELTDIVGNQLIEPKRQTNASDPPTQQPQKDDRV